PSTAIASSNGMTPRPQPLWRQTSGGPLPVSSYQIRAPGISTKGTRSTGSIQDAVEPLADDAHHGRKQDAWHEASHSEPPSEDRSFVRQHANRADERLGRE